MGIELDVDAGDILKSQPSELETRVARGDRLLVPRIGDDEDE